MTVLVSVLMCFALLQEENEDPKDAKDKGGKAKAKKPAKK